MIMQPERGNVVLSKAGKDKGMLFAVVYCDGEYCGIVNGKLRKLDSVKRKKLRHVQMTKYVLPEEALTSDKKIRKALNALSEK